MPGSPRKEQLHSSYLKIWNFKGNETFESFAPTGVKSSDVWFCSSDENVSIDNGLVTIRPMDLVIALVDNPGDLTKENIGLGKWQILRHITDSELEQIMQINQNAVDTYWAKPVHGIFGNTASVQGILQDEYFIVVNVAGTWNEYTGKDVYGNTVSAANNAVYKKGLALLSDPAKVYYLATLPYEGLVLYNISSNTLKVYNGTLWTNLAAGTGIVSGEILRAKTEFEVNTDPGGNYDTITHILTVGIILQETDNVNIYVNGVKYSNTGTDNAISFLAGDNYVTWLENNVNFDLVSGDLIEIEIFNNV